jgi:hypothetical protein
MGDPNQLPTITSTAYVQNFEGGSGGAVQFGQGNGAQVSTWSSSTSPVQIQDLTPPQYDAWRSNNPAYTNFPSQFPYGTVTAVSPGSSGGSDQSTAGANNATQTASSSGNTEQQQPLPSSPGANPNNIGKVVARNAPSNNSPANANPPVSPETQKEKSWLQSVGDWLGDRFNEMGQAVQHPSSGAQGALKAIGNLPADTWNVLSSLATSGAAGELNQASGIQGLANPEAAQFNQNLANDMIHNPSKYTPQVAEPFTLNNEAERGGADLFNIGSVLIPIGGEAKGLLTGAKELDELGEATSALNEAEKTLQEGADASETVKPTDGGKVKRGPKTDPDAPHNAKIRAIAEELKRKGNKILAGGGEQPEKLVPTDGGIKSGRRPDIIYQTPSGEINAINVGLTNADGTPITREAQALQDLNGPGKLPTKFVPYDR